MSVWLNCLLKVLLSDFFLCNCAEEFMEAARHFIFETYCRIHHKIDIGMLAGKMVCDNVYSSIVSDQKGVFRLYVFNGFFLAKTISYGRESENENTHAAVTNFS